MTSKQRAYLRKMAHALTPECFIGKEGLSASVQKQMDEYLTAHELLKVQVQNNLDCEPAELAEACRQNLGAECVQQLGRRFVLYRRSEKLASKGRSLVLPR